MQGRFIRKQGQLIRRVLRSRHAIPQIVNERQRVLILASTAGRLLQGCVGHLISLPSRDLKCAKRNKCRSAAVPRPRIPADRGNRAWWAAPASQPVKERAGRERWRRAYSWGEDDECPRSHSETALRKSIPRPESNSPAPHPDC